MFFTQKHATVQQKYYTVNHLVLNNTSYCLQGKTCIYSSKNKRDYSKNKTIKTLLSVLKSFMQFPGSFLTI